MFRKSLKELTSIKIIVLCGLLIAAGAAIEAINPLNMGDLIKIRFDFIAVAVMGYVAGPVASAFAAGVGDIVRFIIKPTGVFFPGYTISAIAGGFIYGLFLYKLSIKNNWKSILSRCFFAKLSINVIVNLVLNTIWVMMTQGKALMAIFPLRALKNLCALPIEVAILFVVISFVVKSKHRLV